MQPPWNADDLKFDPADFSGIVRLFPLPDFVLFPHVMQPLHIFEERYREMLSDALAGDRLITMASLDPGWELDYDSRPPIAPVACLGKIVAHHQLPDGTANVLLLGVARVQLIRELSPLRAFRQGEVELICDGLGSSESEETVELHRELLETFHDQIHCECHLPEQVHELISEHVPLSALTDLLAYALPLPHSAKLSLLAEHRAGARANLLLKELRRLHQQEMQRQRSAKRDAAAIQYPLMFSQN